MHSNTLRIALLVSFFPVVAGAQDKSAKLLPSSTPVEKAIDHYIERRLQEDEVKPAPRAEDASFLRRVTLDLVGRIPTTTEVDKYLANRAPDKKVKSVDRLLASPGFVSHFANRFTVMLSPITGNRRGNSGALRDYLKNSIAENRRWDKMFRELILPDQVDPKQKGANEFLKSRIRDLNQATMDVSSIFFGVNISCAQCHDHPHVPSWTQDHFYGMKSFFSRTFDNGGFLAERSYGSLKYTPNKGKQKTAPVMFLTGKKLTPPNWTKTAKNAKRKDQDKFKRAKKAKKPAATPKFSLRAKLLEISLEPSQRAFFSRAIVNRLWRQLLGYGLVMPLDQMHVNNPTSHPELLQWLARDVENNRYTLRRLIRGIVLSDAYARSSKWPGADVPSSNLFAVGKVRALAPNQLGMSLLLAVANPQSIPAKQKERRSYFDQLRKKAGGLANQFPEPGADFQVGVDEAMLFSNNEGLQRDLLSGNNLVSVLAKIGDVDKRTNVAVKSILSRDARPEETKVIGEYFRSRQSNVEEACRQVVWALLTGAEFRFNH